MTTCLLFADQMRRFAVNSVVVGLNTSPSCSSATSSSTVEGNSSNHNHHQRASRRKARLDSQTTYVCRETAHESFQRMLAKFADTFDSQVTKHSSCHRHFKRTSTKIYPSSHSIFVFSSNSSCENFLKGFGPTHIDIIRNLRTCAHASITTTITRDSFLESHEGSTQYQ